ncbi:MAG: hypothetical protein ABIM64_04100 [candidate division WOR-3 bacterium]
MGILQKLIDKNDEYFNEEKIVKSRIKKVRCGTPDEILNDPSEVERLSKYISEKYKKKIININTGIKYGVKKIGTEKDTNNVLRQLLSGATKEAQKKASLILVKKFKEDNLKEVIKTKTGKEIIGKMISKNIYIKEVNVTYLKGAKAGKKISYLQAKNINTGKIVSYKTALRLLGKNYGAKKN